MATAQRIRVHDMDVARLEAAWTSRVDQHGNNFREVEASGDGEPLRCCLRFAERGEPITLVSYAPFDHPSVWTEVGPVYIHSQPCSRYGSPDRLPDRLDLGPCVLRTYRNNHTMNYQHNTVVTDDTELTPIIGRLLAEPDVALVHVRSLAPQCFLYAVTAA